MKKGRNRTTAVSALLFTIASFSSHAQEWQHTKNGITLVTNQTVIEIQFYTDSSVRILKSPVATSFRKQSLSVIATPREIKLLTKVKNNELNISSGVIRVNCDRETGTIRFYNKKGEQLLQEKKGSAYFRPFNDAGDSTYTVSQSFVLDKEEPIYGLGQQQQGKMVQRNLTLRMEQGNTHDYIPFFQSVKGYGLFWDNYSPTLFTDNEQATSFTSDVGDGIDYYFMYGGSADGVIGCMRELTGRVPMFPLWTYGYFQSKERYKSQDELIAVVKKYRDLKVPLDGIIQDWQYWGNNYLWNAMEFLNEDFPNAPKMISELHRLQAHLAISVWNSFGPNTKQYRELDSLKALMNFSTWPQSGSSLWPPKLDYPSGVKVYDPYNADARDIYWKYLSKLFALGVDAWWMDSSEPDHLDAKPADLDNKTAMGSFRKVRNAFPLMTVGGVYDHQRAVSSAKRVFIFTRSAFAGQQRYAANTWSGDVVASWTALRNQVSAGLNFSLTGIPYWNSDIGGFFLWNFKRRLEDPEYRELYVRWLQFGAFCPMMRSHGTDAPREIYQFGAKGDRLYDAIDKYIQLRYRLLPYIYATSWEVTAHHSSMMRALFMDFPADKKAWDLNDQYMFGKSILVSPVTRAMYVKPVTKGMDTLMAEDFSKVRSKELYLPAGTDWYDFWNGERRKGGEYVSRKTPLDLMPVYIKAGSLIPMGPRVQFAGEKKWDDLEIRIYPGADGKFVLYEDENDNYNYEKGIYSAVELQWDDKKGILTIGDRQGSFPGMLTSRQFSIVLVNTANGIGEDRSLQPDKTVTYTGNKILIKL